MEKEIELFTAPVTEEIELSGGRISWDAIKHNNNNKNAIYYVQDIHEFVMSILSAKNKKNTELVINNTIRDKGKQKKIIELALSIRITDKNHDFDEGLQSTIANRISEYIDNLNNETTEVGDKARSDKVSFDKASVDEEKKQNENNLTQDPNIKKRLDRVLTKAKGAPSLNCYVNGEEKIFNAIPNQINTYESPDAQEAIAIINGVIDDKNICRFRIQEIEGVACNKILELIFEQKDRNELIEAQLEYNILKISFKATILLTNGIEQKKGGMLVDFEKYEFPQADFGFNEE